MGEHKTIHKVAIIGGGPKGIYGFERLTAWLKIHPPSEKTEIHIYNRSDSFGAGENYRTEQPSFLLMNNPVGEINMWCDEKPLPVVPKPLSFPDWLYHTTGISISKHEYTSRAMAGRYLSYGFNLIGSNLPENIDAKYIVGEVVDMVEDFGKYVLNLKASGDGNNRQHADRYDHILLATGHPKPRKTKQSINLQSFADEHEMAGYIPFIYPVETMNSNIPPGCSVGIKGMGLTFVDAVLALTEGKGGRFTKDEKTDKLIYIPSGDEPKVIYPFSRSGLPMIPRKSVPNENNKLRFFTRTELWRFESDKKINFEDQIWPLLRQDMIYAYYDIALKNDGEPEGLSLCKNFKDVERFVADYHKKHPFEIHFEADLFLDPLQDKEYQEEKRHDQFVRSLYNHYLHEALKGELKSPFAAVSAVWRKATSLFCELYAFGGLTPESQQHFDESVRGNLNRVTFGPPVKNGEKLCALMDTGILNFNAARNPDLISDDKSGSYVLQSRPDGIRYSVQYLVDARIPKVSLDDDPGPLFQNLLNSGLITLFENRLGEKAYQPGAINITRQGFVIDKNGVENQGIAVTGTPTEGITFDNDTLSRDRNNFVDHWAECISKEYAKSTIRHYAY